MDRRSPHMRSSLEPLWTAHRDSNGPIGRSPMRSASPRSPRSLPSPMHLLPAGYDNSMRRHERAMVQSLNLRPGMAGPPDGPHGLPSLPPISEIGVMQQQQRRQEQQLAPRRQTMVSETRSMLLSGVPESRIGPISTKVDRRRSLPAVTPVSAGPGARRNSQQVRQELRAWGHVYLGDGASADCFVAAVALRRPSEPLGAIDASPPPPPPSPATDTTASAIGTTQPVEQAQDQRRVSVTIRVRVRPRVLERKPFLIQRTFDLDSLRATIPDPGPLMGGAFPPLAALPGLSAAGASLPPYELTSRRPSADLSSRSLAHMRRRSSSNAAPGLKVKSGLELDRPLARSANAMPIHFAYARVHLPVLAALVLSGHIGEGDIIDIPIPHPAAWSQTVAHVYTGQGELTESIRQNILYLGGKA